jgi:hypothetical protein
VDVLIDEDEYLAEFTFWRVDGSDAVPRIIFAPEDDTSVVHRIGDPFPVEIIETRIGFGSESTLVIENHRLTAPRGVPVIMGVHVKNLRSQFDLGITMRRYVASIRRVVPMNSRANMLCAHDLGDELSVLRAEKFCDESLPGWGDIQAFLVLKREATVFGLFVLTCVSKMGFEKRDVRHMRGQLFKRFIAQKAFRVGPREWIHRAEGVDVDSFECVQINVFQN